MCGPGRGLARRRLGKDARSTEPAEELLTKPTLVVLTRRHTRRSRIDAHAQRSRLRRDQIRERLDPFAHQS